MERDKIQGKFYPLQHEEWLRACRELTPAQKDVLYFIRTLDPYGDGVELSVSGIAKQLSTQDKEVHRSTVSRALKALDEKGFIDLELLRVKVMVLGKGFHCCDETTTLPTDNSVVSTQQARSPRNKRDREATSVIVRQQARSPRNNQASKPSQGKDSNSSKTIKTIKTNSDFIKTLSEDERENFENFCQKKIEELPKKPALPDKWIAANHKELYKQFLASSDGIEAKKQAILSKKDWRSDSRFDSWICEAYYRGYEWVHENEAEREQRKAFYDWGFASKALAEYAESLGHTFEQGLGIDFGEGGKT